MSRHPRRSPCCWLESLNCCTTSLHRRTCFWSKSWTLSAFFRAGLWAMTLQFFSCYCFSVAYHNRINYLVSQSDHNPNRCLSSPRFAPFANFPELYTCWRLHLFSTSCGTCILFISNFDQLFAAILIYAAKYLKKNTREALTWCWHPTCLKGQWMWFERQSWERWRSTWNIERGLINTFMTERQVESNSTSDTMEDAHKLHKMTANTVWTWKEPARRTNFILQRS